MQSHGRSVADVRRPFRMGGEIQGRLGEKRHRCGSEVGGVNVRGAPKGLLKGLRSSPRVPPINAIIRILRVQVVVFATRGGYNRVGC